MPTILRPESAAIMTPNADEIGRPIVEYLRTKHISPTASWLASFISTVRQQTPLVAQQKSALFRILAADLTVATESSSVASFPTNLADPEVRERKLAGPVIAQVLDIEDIGRSRWSQVEALEAQQRGETTKGREVIRVVPDETTAETREPVAGAGPHKILLQDALGTKVFGIELEAIRGFGVQMGIGAKVVLRDLVVARGVLLMKPGCVEILGGRVEVWDKKWRAERMEILKRQAGMQASDGG